jgi:hypothetical protein
MLITAGLVLNCIIFGALFRPLEAPKKGKKTQVTDYKHFFNPPFLGVSDLSVKSMFLNNFGFFLGCKK